MKLSFLLATTWLLLAAPAWSQTVTETRTFNQEYFDTGTGPAATWWPNFDLGLQGPTQESHGQVHFVDIQITAQWDIDMLVLNDSGAPNEFRWMNSMYLAPAVGDCSPYRQIPVNFSSGLLNPDEVGTLSYGGVHNYSWSGSTFNTFCNSNFWPWQDLSLWHGTVSNPQPFTYGGGFSVPVDWVRILDFGAWIDGHVTVEWTPDPLPTTSVCPGNSTTGASLIAGGAFDNLWLMQTGTSTDFNFLLQSDEATSVVPTSGLCVGGATGTILRLYDSLSLGGEPHRLPYDTAFAGTTQYFQAWYRTPGGGAETGECIGVTFP